MQSYPRAFVILGADQKNCRLPEKIDFYVFYGKIKGISSILDQCFCFIWFSVIIPLFACFLLVAVNLNPVLCRFWDLNGVGVVKEGQNIS